MGSNRLKHDVIVLLVAGDSSCSPCHASFYLLADTVCLSFVLVFVLCSAVLCVCLSKSNKNMRLHLADSSSSSFEARAPGRGEGEDKARGKLRIDL